MIATSVGTPIQEKFLHNYFAALVNRFFKILPIKEETPSSLAPYLNSLKMELLGCEQLISTLDGDPLYVTLLSVTQFLSDNPDYPQRETRREVFRAIDICKKLQKTYAEGGGT